MRGFEAVRVGELVLWEGNGVTDLLCEVRWGLAREISALHHVES